MGKCGMQEQTRQILEMRKSGASLGKIADAFGLKKNSVKGLCSKYGVVGCDNLQVTEEEAKALIESTGFDYVGGFTNYHGLVKIRCRTCGTVAEHWYRNIRDRVLAPSGWVNKDTNSLICRYCAHEETKRKQNEKKKAEQAEREALETARQERKAEQLSRELQKRLATHVCRNCGKQYVIAVTGYNSEMYCSKRCLDRRYASFGSRSREKRIKERVHDKDISLDKLYNRDGGICYICGKKCSWNDIKPWKGTRVAGDDYPSIDHVKPLAKGGTHTWDNIKLACRRCNSLKSWKIMPPVGAKS